MAENTKGRGAGGRGRFATTHWSVVLAAGDRAVGGWRDALSQLCLTYWYPLYAFARRMGRDPEEAQDLTQEFFARLLERDMLQHAHPEKGRFRTFLLSCFRNFLTDEYRSHHARKRGGGAPPIPIELVTAEGRYMREPSHDQTPEKIFERRWALTLLQRALDSLEREYAGTPREEVFSHLKRYLPGGKGSVPYSETARALGMTEVTVKVAVHRLRARFRNVLLDEIAHTVERPEEVEAELRYLLAALGD